MKLTKQQTNQLIRESILRFNRADRKMSLLSEQKITIEKMLVSEGFVISAIFRRAAALPPVEGDLPAVNAPAFEAVYVGDEARRIHAQIPAKNKVIPPAGVVNGFANPALDTYNLIFNEFDNDLIGTNNSKEMSGVDTEFPIFAAYTTTKPTADTPPCIEMLLKAIKQKDNETPYRIDDEQLIEYEQTAAELISSMLVGNLAPSLAEQNPIFIVVACPSTSEHTGRLATAIQAKLTTGRVARNNPAIITRQQKSAGSFVNLHRKVTYGEAADAINDPDHEGHITFAPNEEVKVRHNILHELWKEMVEESFHIMQSFKALKLRPVSNWLIVTARTIAAQPPGGCDSSTCAALKLLLEMEIPKLGLNPKLTPEVIYTGLTDPDYINEAHLEETTSAGEASRKFLSELIIDPLGLNEEEYSVQVNRLTQFLSLATTGSGIRESLYETALKIYQQHLRGMIPVAAASGYPGLTEVVIASTYSLPFDQWLQRQQQTLNSNIVRSAEQNPTASFSISKVSAVSGNRKHVTGFIKDNPDHNQQAEIARLNAINTTNRPYVLVVVDDNVETGTTMREVANRSKAALADLVGEEGFADIFGATALAIRNTVRCSTYTK